jgi:hypothetical protein
MKANPRLPRKIPLVALAASAGAAIAIVCLARAAKLPQRNRRPPSLSLLTSRSNFRWIAMWSTKPTSLEILDISFSGPATTR